MIVRGVKISLLNLRDVLTGKEMIPFQEDITNGKFSTSSIIDYIVDDPDVRLLSVVYIVLMFDRYDDLQAALATASVGDTFFNKLNNKLYTKTEEDYVTTDPKDTKLYVLLSEDNTHRTDVIYRWNDVNKQFVELTADRGILTKLDLHIANTSNPHEVTKNQVGLSEVTNDSLVKRSEMGVAGGVATLDGNAKVPSEQLPSYVDDVIEVNTYADLPTIGEKGKIYVTLDTNLTYRWSGSIYIEISKSLELGETSTTAYPGDKGHLNRVDIDDIREDLGATESDLNIKIEAETARAIAAESILNTKIDTEVKAEADRAKAEEARIESKAETLVNAEATRAKAAEKANTDAITAEVTRAKEAEKTNADNIVIETNRAKAAETALDTKIEAETSRATTAEASLANDLTTEVNRATAKEAELASTISTNKTNTDKLISDSVATLEAADTALGGRIDTEITNRTNSDAILQGNIDQEEADRIAAINTVNQSILAITDSKGKANGIATLDATGLVPAAQLPSYVDDVIEANTFDDLPLTGEVGKIYVTIDDNITYRWSGTGYVEISKSIALGETSATAYPGDKGKATTDKLNKVPNTIYKGFMDYTYSPIGVAINLQYKNITDNNEVVSSKTIAQSSATNAGVMSATDKVKLDKVITTGTGDKYLADNGTYKSFTAEGLVVDTSKVEVAQAIPVAGGPLADLLNDAGITNISLGTDMQELLMQLFTKEMWPSGLTFTEGTVKASLNPANFTLASSGTLVEVNTTLALSSATLAAATASSTNRTYSGFTYGYSLANDNTQDNASTTITAGYDKVATINPTEYTMIRTFQGFNGEQTDDVTNTNVASMQLPAKTLLVLPGVNKVTINSTGPTATAIFKAMPVYYACSNLLKTSNDHASIAKDAKEITSNTSSSTKEFSVTAVYPYYTNKDNVANFSRMPLTTSRSMNAVKFVAETSTNHHAIKIPTEYPLTKIQLLNTLSGNYEDYPLNKFTKVQENVSIMGTEYTYNKYTRNDGVNGESTFNFIF